MTTIGELFGYKGEVPEVEHFTLEDRAPGFRWIYRCDTTNAKGETLTVEVSYCYDHGGKNSLPKLWHRKGYCDYIPEWWTVNTYATDADGNCRGRYNPCNKPGGAGYVINFDWHLSATPGNLARLLEETYRRFTETR